MRSQRTDLGSVRRNCSQVRFWLHIQRTFVSELFTNGVGNLELSELPTGVVPADAGRLGDVGTAAPVKSRRLSKLESLGVRETMRVL